MEEGRDPVQNKLFSFCADSTCFCCFIVNVFTLPVYRISIYLLNSGSFDKAIQEFSLAKPSWYRSFSHDVITF